eukprot:Blabericola_migrator_1__12225@NODE_760_length_6627_cov_45_648933_g83_i2_p10_GENE_NODE_760_length_6627_cov_45_648933_g83_i2NODE_760_length_6627_cov_45_648933_g83_i2_p10_ORF_typecomplete_len105_score23_98_NODE_760_length_6627_cov_45_648933_g83_i239564270
MSVTDGNKTKKTSVSVTAKPSSEAKSQETAVHLQTEDATIHNGETRWIDGSSSSGQALKFRWELISGAEYCQLQATGDVPTTAITQYAEPAIVSVCEVCVKLSM